MVLLLLLAQADAAAMVAAARAQVAGPGCRYESAATDITVCGRRHSDRYRVPLATEPPRGAATPDSVIAERAALVHRATPLEQLSPFLVGGGHVGVTAGVAFGPGAGSGATRIRGARPLAP